MQLSLTTDEAIRLDVGLLGVLCFEDQVADGPAFSTLDRALDGLLGRLVGEERFKGKKGQGLAVHSHGRIGPARVLLVGAGPRKEFQPVDLRAFAARVARAAAASSLRRVALALPEAEVQSAERAAQLVAEGARLARYRFDRYQGEEKRQEEVPLDEVVLVLAGELSDEARQEAVRRGLSRAEHACAAVALARDLVNEPASAMTPRQMAEVARQVAKDHRLEARILGPKDCEKLGMGMLLAVARGSEEEPRFIHLTYRPRGKPRRKVALVGKGVTFDSGGLALKPLTGMEDMKTDMAGAATVIAAVGALAELGVPFEVHALAPCAENMPSGRAYRVGDVLRSLAGKTVEINNTDAEGRLLLGDALAYAVREIAPDEILDFATLTGACMVALGPHTAGVMGSDLSLIERWLAAARRAGEDMWHLPLPERLKEMLKSEIADLRNTGERWGGALTAGLFLKEFVGATPWLHVDLAGPASTDKEKDHQTKGGTGFGVATIIEYLAGRE